MLIEIFSDVVCPWCYIGKRRLDTVLRGSAGGDVDVVWRPYLLHPGIPAGGLDRGDYLRRRYGEQADPAKIPERIRREASDVGLEFDFARIERMPNTRDAHRLLTWAEPSGRQHALSERLFSGYFTQGEDVGDRDVLARCAADAGLDAQAAAGFLDGGDGEARLDDDLARATEASVAGVPNYLIAERFVLPGAQTSDVMERFIDRAKIVLGREAAQA